MAQKNTIRIAIDAMGGDFAPVNEIQGAISAFNSKSSDVDFEIIFVGKEDIINDAIAKLTPGNLKYTIFHTDDVVTMHDDPTAVIKKKKNSSLYKGIELLTNDNADAFLSAGNTGAVLSTATILLGRLKGVSRPTIGTFFPTEKNYPVFVLDVGGNVDCKPRFLYEFGVMGSIYISNMLGILNPKIGLLNVGEESSKGNEAALQAHELLSKSDLNFIGNIEGSDIFKVKADVAVCDGFTGNIILKFAESFVGLLKNRFRQFAKKNILNKIMIALFYPIFKKVLKDFDYQNYGGVPLLGVNGVVIIGHGKSSPLAIQNMIYKAIEQYQKDINKKIEKALNQNILQQN